MKEKLCIVSEYNVDFCLVEIMKQNRKYELQTIFLTNTAELKTTYICGVKIVNSTHIECFEECDKIFFSKNCHSNIEFYRSLVLDKYPSKIINFEIDFNYQESFTYHSINIPIVIVTGEKCDCGKNLLISKLIKVLEENGEKVSVISNYENSKILGYYQFPNKMLSSIDDYDKIVQLFNSFLNYVVEKSFCSVLILSIPGGICNQYCSKDCKSEIISYILSKSCEFDYSIHLLSVDSWNKELINEVSRKNQVILNKEVDYWVLTNQLYDSTLIVNIVDTATIPTICISNNDILEGFVKDIGIKNANYINKLYIGEMIFDDILEKLKQEELKFKIL